MKHTTIINKVLMLISPIFVLTTLWVFLHFVDLSPKITPDFFFSSDSEIFKKDQQIQQEFPFAQQVILNIAAPNIQAQNYVSKIETLSTKIEELPDVDSVNSITHGPKNIEEALNNPLWKRLLIGEKQKSSSIVVFVKTENYTPRHRPNLYRLAIPVLTSGKVPSSPRGQRRSKPEVLGVFRPYRLLKHSR